MSDIDEEFQRRVRERAYHLWQGAGAPEGRSDEFWQEAQRLEETLRYRAPVGAPDEQNRHTSATETTAETLTHAELPTHRGVV